MHDVVAIIGGNEIKRGAQRGIRIIDSGQPPGEGDFEQPHAENHAEDRKPRRQIVIGEVPGLCPW